MDNNNKKELFISIISIKMRANLQKHKHWRGPGEYGFELSGSLFSIVDNQCLSKISGQYETKHSTQNKSLKLGQS